MSPAPAHELVSPPAAGSTVRSSGEAKSGAAIDLHIVVDPAMTVIESHAITEKMTAVIREKLSGADLTVHIEPCDGSCKKSCVSGCMLTESERLQMQLSPVKIKKM
jgi:hypothetical protein